MSWLILGACIPPLIISLLATATIRRLAPRLGLLDKPGARKVHTTVTPLGGGIGIWLGVIVVFAVGTAALLILPRPEIGDESWWSRLAQATLLAEHWNGLKNQLPRLWYLLGCGTVLMVLGLIDDRKGLDWKLRILVQTAVAVAMVLGGWRLSAYLQNDWLAGILTVLWIVGLINSFNMLDNMDGLSAGVATIAAGVLAAVLLITPESLSQGPQLFVAGFLLVLMGSLLGFLWHNRPPAKIFMGDAGSYFVGFCLATSTIMATFAGGELPTYSILAPLCVLAVPFYDTLSVIVIRLREGRSPFVGDKSHFSHRLVERGLSKGGAVLTIYLTTTCCGLGALLLHRVDRLGAILILVQVGCILAIVAILESKRRPLP